MLLINFKISSRQWHLFALFFKIKIETLKLNDYAIKKTFKWLNFIYIKLNKAENKT